MEREIRREGISECMSLQDFDIFWEAYPHKKGKSKAEEHWQRIKPVLAEVMAALEIQKQERAWLKVNKKFIPEWAFGSTWVNQQRWRDGYDKDFEEYLKYEQERPLREQRQQEKAKQKIRDDYQNWLEGKSTKALQDAKRDGGYMTGLYCWLIDEILNERNRQISKLQERN